MWLRRIRYVLKVVQLQKVVSTPCCLSDYQRLIIACSDFRSTYHIMRWLDDLLIAVLTHKTIRCSYHRFVDISTVATGDTTTSTCNPSLRTHILFKVSYWIVLNLPSFRWWQWCPSWVDQDSDYLRYCLMTDVPHYYLWWHQEAKRGCS
jgi:hypothetical protein